MASVVIAGLGSAGYAALTAAKRHNPKSEIIVIDPKEYDLMHPCGLPYSLEGKVDPAGLSQDISLHRMGVNRMRGNLSSIDTKKSLVSVEEPGGTVKSVSYGRLVLCLGSRPVIPPVPGLEEIMGTRAFTLRNLSDLEALRTGLESAKRCIVIGGGAIGLETAMAMTELKKSVTVMEMQGQVLPGVLDEDMAGIVKDYLGKCGVTVVTGSAVSAVTSDGSGITAHSAAGDIPADLCVVSAGFAAGVSAAAASGIDCVDNGIVVNDRLMTSVPGVYAAGDCISGWSVINGSVLKAKLATSAYRQGIVAGLNAAGADAAYAGSAGTFVTKIGELEVAGTGFTHGAAEKQGFSPRQGKMRSHMLPDYFPGNSEIHVKIIIDGTTGRVIGAQAIGTRGAAERINIVSTAIEFGLTVDDLGRIEMAYCPAVSEVYDPLLRAADFAKRRKR